MIGFVFFLLRLIMLYCSKAKLHSLYQRNSNNLRKHILEIYSAKKKLVAATSFFCSAELMIKLLRCLNLCQA